MAIVESKKADSIAIKTPQTPQFNDIGQPIDKDGKVITCGKHYFPAEPNKIIQFNTFLSMFKADDETNIDNLVFILSTANTKIAHMLGVDRTTIEDWKKTPQYKHMINLAMKRILSEMRIAGQDDWRMWREFLKMFGVEDSQTIKNEFPDGMPVTPVIIAEESDAIKRIRAKKQIRKDRQTKIRE